MAKVIVDGEIVEEGWQRFNAEQLRHAALPSDSNVIVPLAYWREHKTTLLERGNVAVCLEPGEEPAELADDLVHLPMVVIHFPAFMDGRGYSYARELRARYGFKGEIRAVGDVLLDQ